MDDVGNEPGDDPCVDGVGNETEDTDESDVGEDPVVDTGV